jgi:serine/threonine protein kinase
MKCPRCNHEWDVRQSPCPRCNLYLRVSGRPRSTNSLAPAKEAPMNNAVLSASSSERTAQLRSGPLLESADDRSAQPSSSALFNESQRSRFPTTDRLNVKKTLQPIPQDEASTLSFPKNSSMWEWPVADAGNTASTLSPSKVASLWGLSTAEIANETFVLGRRNSTSLWDWPTSNTSADIQPLTPGTLLHHNRYNLQKNLRRREWPLGVVESVWSAVDTHFTKSGVYIYELDIPQDASHEVQAIPYTATKVFTSIGRHPHILALRDVFRENGRSFFVFEPIQGLSLATLMQRNGGSLSEQEMIACCIQIADLLDICSQQSPPLIHGNIRPEFIMRKTADSQYVLINFSVALAGGLAQVVADMEKVAFSPYKATQLISGKVDGRSDLSALLATVHYTITGRQFSDTSTLAATTAISPLFRTLLSKGLSKQLHQRYQKPSDLYQDLLALRSRYGNMSPALRGVIGEQNLEFFTPIAPTMPKENRSTTSQVPTQPLKEQPEHAFLVPVSQELPPFKEGHDILNAILWFTVMLLGLASLLINRLLS